MNSIFKKSDFLKIYPKRNPDSHKGENGRVVIIGGSIDYFGAPILSGLGAINSGADLAYLLVPECNFDVSRSFYPDFIVRKYPGNFVNSRMLDEAHHLIEKADCVLIGPGMSEDPESIRTVAKIIQKTECDIVLDAEAIPAIAQLGIIAGNHQKRITITPHRGEFDEITEGTLPEDPSEVEKIVEDFANKWGITILLKAHRDVIASPGQPTRVNDTGNAGMTVGGSGDVLAGVTASWIAQHATAYDAALFSAFLVGTAGDNLYNQKGYNFIATDIALELPYTIHGIIS